MCEEERLKWHVHPPMKPVGTVEFSWSIERNCLREDDSSCTPLKREKEKTKQARKPPGY